MRRGDRDFARSRGFLKTVSSLREKLSYANVMATIAVFVSLGGGAYAALRVTGREVVNSSLRGADVRNGSLTGRDIRDRSIGARDLARGAIRQGPQGATGATGSQGRPGPPGATGPQGASAREHWAVVGLNGAILEGSPGATVDRQGPGVYFVRWGVDVSRCAAVVTAGRPAADGTHSPIPREYGVVGVLEQTVRVETIRHDGQTVDASFNVIVTC